ncbi:MAG: hypothetical protein QOH41_2097 [Blastocatellia bacterium]|nr:hypothetical protein [Blastocatellia bacterium]
MIRSRVSYLALLAPLTLFAMLAQAPSVTAQDHITVQPRRVMLLRSRKVARGAPERAKAIVRYPIVSGLTDAAALRRIQKTLAVKNVFDSSIEEYRQDSWLTDFDYKVNYNKNYLLDITFTQDGMGAYPSTSTKHFLIDLRRGTVVKSSDAFNPGSLGTLASMANQKLKAEARELSKDVESDKEQDAEQKKSLQEQLDQLTFTVENLDDFSVSDKGVTFLYDAGFPHVIQALQPDGNYFFSYAELRPHLRPDGPLSVFK